MLLEQGKAAPPSAASMMALSLRGRTSPGAVGAVGWAGVDGGKSSSLAPPSYDGAVKHYRLAAAQGHVKASFRLAECLRKGDPMNRSRGVDMANSWKWCDGCGIRMFLCDCDKNPC